MNALHRIRVLDRDIQVRSTTDNDTVRAVETFVNEKLAEVAASVKVGDTQVVAILALMNIAEQYLLLLKQSEVSNKAADDRAFRLLQRIEASSG